jgi:hypothetical protein
LIGLTKIVFRFTELVKRAMPKITGRNFASLLLDINIYIDIDIDIEKNKV